MDEILDIRQASVWATKHLGKEVSPANISYLVNYGRIKKSSRHSGVFVSKRDLLEYYRNKERKTARKNQLGDDLNWALSFDQYTESERTKHVHRLHPYKGKFIPQLVEYFLDDHTDKHKTESIFKSGDILLDPFCGSGTMLVEANELKMHAIGIDISEFNSLITNVKLQDVDFDTLVTQINDITWHLQRFTDQTGCPEFDAKFSQYLTQYNSEYFTSPDFKIKVREKKIAEKQYSNHHTEIVNKKYSELVDAYSLTLEQPHTERFLDRWFLLPVRREIDFVADLVERIDDEKTQKILMVILSRTIRSCRATKHADLATLVEPVTSPYYCRKHGKICKPLFSMLSWWQRYCKDTIGRLRNFAQKKTDTHQICLTGNSESIDIFSALERELPQFVSLARKQKVRGIFSSPPYVGLIDYHEQHAYAYDLFDFKRRDAFEIGSKANRQNKIAREKYVRGISNVLINSRRFMVKDFDVFLVANDKFGLYTDIAIRSNMQVVNQYRRPVLHRTEKDKHPYSEIIFHLKDNHG